MFAVLSGHCQCVYMRMQRCFFPGQEGGATLVDGLNYQVLLVECCGAIMGVKGLWFLLYSNLKPCQNLLVGHGLICFPITSSSWSAFTSMRLTWDWLRPRWCIANPIQPMTAPLSGGSLRLLQSSLMQLECAKYSGYICEGNQPL